MNKLLVSALCAISSLALSQNVLATGTGSIGPVFIKTVSHFTVPYGSQKPGNTEVQTNGFVLPSGVSCDTTYITTLKSVDPDGELFYMLRDIRNSNQPVTLWITDNPIYTAYPGRCSIVGVTM